MRIHHALALATSILISILPIGCKSSTSTIKDPPIEKTAFQTSSVWKPSIDVRSDVAIIYGTADQDSVTFEQRVASWRDRGYTPHFMTGMAWGKYQDYFTGQWDGKSHLDEGQVTQEGDTIWHGHMIPYIVPSENFIKYMQETKIKRAIDAGIDAIYLEEPEFWARAGYSDAFKKEWVNHYGFAWRPQDASAENTYLSNKLKYFLYYRALKECFTYAKTYGKTQGIDVRCYVPTHSLINYSQWQIISPEASLASLDCVDGYIAQVWTGTSRAPNYYNGLEKERVFETAFLEYGCMESMTAPTNRKVFFLTDPIEDRPRDWQDFKKNYEATFTAKLLYPRNDNYEVMPWPNRIYEGLYKTSIDSDQKETIPRFYSTQIQVMINALNQMPVSQNTVSGSKGISVLMSNSLMFQRTPKPLEGYDDPNFSNFYGLTLPLLKRGIPVNMMHLENVSYPESWKDTKLLLMSYTNMKPMQASGHDYLADWVKKGGVLVYVGRDSDPYQDIQEWWNQGDNHFRTPSAHLFAKMNINQDAHSGIYEYGKGTVYIIRKDPKEFVLTSGGDTHFLDTIKKLYEDKAQAGNLVLKNNFYLERGAFDLISVLEDGINNEPYKKQGKLIDLFNPELPILKEKTVYPGERAFLIDIDRVKENKKPQVLATASRIYQEERTPNTYSFVAKSPLNTTNVMRILLPNKPISIAVIDKQGHVLKEAIQSWDAYSNTCLLKFENDPEGISVTIRW
ncbi:MAG: hypothetical protein WCR36_02815 [Bacteroidaceae bacterium]